MWCSRRRAQASVEYLFVVALALLLIIPATYLFFDFSKDSEDSVVAAQINRLGLQITTKAEEIYVLGNNSRVTLELSVPDAIASAIIYDERELVMSYYTQSGTSQAVFFTDFNMTNGTHRCVSNPCNVSLPPGLVRLRVISRGDHVWVAR